jgi:hypothetical protein
VLLKRFAAILLGLLLLAHALVPALPKYVCVGMGGAHFLQPCCPDRSAEHRHDGQPAWERARCCQAEPPVAIEAQRPQPDNPLRILELVSHSLTIACAFDAPPAPPVPRGLGTARGDPALIAPPPRLFVTLHVLRI